MSNHMSNKCRCSRTDLQFLVRRLRQNKCRCSRTDLQFLVRLQQITKKAKQYGVEEISANFLYGVESNSTKEARNPTSRLSPSKCTYYNKPSKPELLSFYIFPSLFIDWIIVLVLCALYQAFAQYKVTKMVAANTAPTSITDKAVEINPAQTLNTAVEINPATTLNTAVDNNPATHSHITKCDRITAADNSFSKANNQKITTSDSEQVPKYHSTNTHSNAVKSEHKPDYANRAKIERTTSENSQLHYAHNRQSERCNKVHDWQTTLAENTPNAVQLFVQNSRHTKAHRFPTTTTFTEMLETLYQRYPEHTFSYNGKILHKNDYAISTILTENNITIIATPKLKGGTGANATDKKVETASAAPAKPPKLACPTFFIGSDGTPLKWFHVFETWATQCSITDQLNKALTLIQYLQPTTLAAITNLDTLLSGDKPFDHIKAAICKAYLPSQQDQFNLVFAKRQTGNMKPSALLHKLRNDLCNAELDVTNNQHILRRYFLSSLPSQIQAALVLLPSDTTLDDMASKADRIYECTKDTVTPAHTENINSVSATQQNQLDTIIAALQALVTHKNQPTRVTPSSRRQSPQRKKGKFSKICYFHTRYGKSAHKCYPGCQFDKPSSSVKMQDTCIYHDHFGPDAKICRPGCKFHQPSKN